ncbi:uncharacterized protein LOC106656287 isoform X1 [Trichogramma pretiosum]|uniref:uncharacterized protein LOC106656287 isoform X1 n=1 Tax=Trichogramma pretiosum TaxID=7493 RepID=UPI0006C9988F|nr:uncharacterized protein LOC106656287 isoform X1 [Trichogramma pretiosum]
MQYSPVKFSDVKNDMRYKNLERTLDTVRSMDRLRSNTNANCPTPSWPSLSSIHDSSYVHTPPPSLQVSRVESEVVASSNNLRMLSGLKNKYSNTPSNTKQPSGHSTDLDRVIMPPPSTKRSLTKAKVLSRIDEHSINDDHSNAKVPPSGISTDIYQDDGSNHASDAQEPKKIRIFSRWKVSINTNGSLIIRGLLENHQLARSKPILKRHSHDMVESVCKHIYKLIGNIVDDNKELPEYVCGKFYNGFPDDWENVYHIWKNFISEGSLKTFRWPTPITDDDDDLRSDISEFVYRQKNINNEIQIHKNDQSNELEKKPLVKENLSQDQNVNSSTPKNGNQVTKNENPKHTKAKDSHICPHEINNDQHQSMESHSTSGHNFSSNLTNPGYLREIIKEDKLKIILGNLGNENCPPNYLDKFIELIDNLRYLLSYGPKKQQEMFGRSSSPCKNTSDCQKCNSSAVLETQENVLPESKNASEQIKYYENSKEALTLQNHNNNLECSESSHDSSDGEKYLGIPNVHLEKLLQKRISKSRHHSSRKFRNNERSCKQTVLKQYDSSVSIIEDDSSEKKTHLQEIAISRKQFSSLIDQNKASTPKNEEICIKLPNSQPLRENQNVLNKPVIKSIEQIQVNVQLKRLSKNNITNHSDISVIDDEVTKKKLKPSESNKLKYSNNEDDKENQNSDDELLQHRFLTYDSEDFMNDEEKELALGSKDFKSAKERTNVETKEKLRDTHEKQNMKLQDKRQKPLDESKADFPYGSKKNPKIIEFWYPVVTFDNDSKKKKLLKFEGKLLNEAGHILDRKFLTTAVKFRHSSKLIETFDKEFFLLSGDLNTKHGIPSELIKKCRAGCPPNIDEFCEEWMMFKLAKNFKTTLESPSVANAENSFSNDTLDPLQVSMNSRGRRIISPMEFWRVNTPDTENINLLTKSTERQGIKNNVKPEAHENVSKSNSKLTKLKEPPDIESKVPSPRKKVAHKLEYSSSSESEVDGKSKPNKTRRNSKKNSRSSIKKDSKDSKSKANDNTEMGPPESNFHTKLRKRRKLDYKESENNTKNCKLETVRWVYEKHQNPNDDVLSDDQASLVVI